MKYTITILLLCTTLIQADKPTKKKPSTQEKMMQLSFEEFDSDNNQKISFKEIQAFQLKKRKERAIKQIERTFQNCDKNNDRKISKDEAISEIDINIREPHIPVKRSTCHFPVIALEMMDANKDGFLSYKEAVENTIPTAKQKAIFAKKTASIRASKENEERTKYERKHFQECDKDKDELLSLREATSRICRMDSDTFFQLDKDEDEMLSLAESSDTQHIRDNHARNKIQEKHFQDAPPQQKLIMAVHICDADNDGMLSQDEAFHGDCGVESDIFKKYDSNKDGFVDMQESAMIHQHQEFDNLDKNKDGFLNFKEFGKSYYWRKMY